MSKTTTETFHGSCHCGALRFEVSLDPSGGATMCNCSICTKLGGRNAITKPEAFVATQGETLAGTYAWGGKTGTRYFCKTCGVHCYGRGYLEEVGGAYVSVNLNCLDDLELAGLPVKHWDGRHDNWMAGPREEPWPALTAAP